MGLCNIFDHKQTAQVLESLRRIKQLYALRGFTVRQINGDPEFEPLRDGLNGESIRLETVAEDEHVPEVERYIRIIKERVRATWNTLPFKRLPTRMVIELVTGAVLWLNIFPPNGGSNIAISPRTLITGVRPDYNKHCLIECGAYVQTHEEHDNSMDSRTVGAIALQPCSSSQKGHYFMSLVTGKRLHRCRWTKLPMPQEAIDRVHMLAANTPNSDALVFGWRDGTPVDTDDDDAMADPDYFPEDDADSTDDDIDLGSIAGVNLNEDNTQNDDDNTQNDTNNTTDDEAETSMDPETDDENEQYIPPANNQPDEPREEAPAHNHDQNDEAVPENMEPIEISDPENDERNSEANDADPHVNGTTAGVDRNPHSAIAGVPADQMDAAYGPRRRDGLRDRRPRDYSKALGLMDSSQHTMMINGDITPTEMVAFTQYTINRGLKEFGSAGAEAVVVEMQQLHNRQVGTPVRANMLTENEKRKALEYLMFLKKKRCGKIKGRGCADGRKQRVYKTKEETSSPTAKIESLFISVTMDAKEGRYVVTCDIPGAFMQADVDELIHVRFSGPLAHLLTKVDPKLYGRYVAYERGKPVIYLKLRKALYGTLQAALLFWKDLSGALKDWGFIANLYDDCVANKDVNGSQCTILWHVDDLKISHKDPRVVEDIVDKLNERYGKEAPLVVNRGKVHDYLGMTIDYSTPGKAIIRMDYY